MAGPTIDHQVGKRLANAVRRSGLADAEVARRVGVTVDELDAHRAGTRRIPPAELLRYARVLDVDLVWFFDDASTEPGSGTTDEPRGET